MSNELKSFFENELKEHLASQLSSYKNITVIKNEIKIKKTKGNSAHASIGLDYIANARGYILSMSVSSPEFQQFVIDVSPPYRSNLLTEYALALTSSGEKTKTFSPSTGGAVSLPLNPEKLKETILWITEKITSIYLPRAMNLIHFSEELISDVINAPDDYSHPFLLILYTTKKRGIAVNQLNEDIIFSKKISKNINFDKSVLLQHIANKKDG